MTREEMITACVDDQIKRGIIKKENREVQIKARLTGWNKMGWSDCKKWYDEVFANDERSKRMEKKYYIVEISDGSEYDIAASDNKGDAIARARNAWKHLSDYDKGRTTIEVRVYADEEHVNYDTVEWGYLVSYGTGAGDEYAPTIEDAKDLADRHAAYTQTEICIVDVATGEMVAIRGWYRVEVDPDTEDEYACISFGRLGHFGEWQEV